MHGWYSCFTFLFWTYTFRVFGEASIYVAKTRDMKSVSSLSIIVSFSFFLGLEFHLASGCLSCYPTWKLESNEYMIIQEGCSFKPRVGSWQNSSLFCLHDSNMNSRTIQAMNLLFILYHLLIEVSLTSGSWQCSWGLQFCPNATCKGSEDAQVPWLIRRIELSLCRTLSLSFVQG